MTNRVAILLCLGLFLVPLGAADSIRVYTYEAAGIEVPVGNGHARGPELNAADPSGGAATGDGRVDAGRILVDVPAGTARVTLTVSDAVFDYVPLRIEAFKPNGARESASTLCAPWNGNGVVSLAPSVSVVVLRVSAVNAAGVCPPGALSGATNGHIAVAFS